MLSNRKMNGCILSHTQWLKFFLETSGDNHSSNQQFSYLAVVKTLCFLLSIFIVSASALAQTKLDSLSEKKDAAQHKVDSLLSFNPQLPEMPDSIKREWQKVDSIRTSFNQQADSLNQLYQQSIGSINKEVQEANRTIDSLTTLRLPANKYTAKLDSLLGAKDKASSDYNGKADALKAKTIGKLDNIEMTPGVQQAVGPLRQQVQGFRVSENSFVKLPKVDIPGFKTPALNGIEGGSLSLGKIGDLGGIPKVDTPLGDVNAVTGELKGLSEDVKNITDGNLKDVQNIDKTIENQAGKIEGVQELQKASGVAEGYQGKIIEMNNPDALKQQGMDMAKEQAVNHFAGKEEVLKGAMEKVSKLKQKYSSISSIDDIPKLPRNSMKGKPVIERIIPGMYLQFQQKRGVNLFDVNPYVGYRISGRFTGGLGWNQRLAYDTKLDDWTTKYQIFGPRAFVDFKLGKGFTGHLETEMMNTFVPSVLSGNQEHGQREWVSSTMLGIKKSYKIYKNLNGTALMQYNLHNPYFKAPYVDRLNSRMGFEYVLRKKPKKQVEQQPTSTN
jgi:hypothetical protein